MTAKAASRAPADEAGFQLLAEHLPDLILFVPLPDERGAVIGGMVIARDVTDQRRASPTSSAGCSASPRASSSP